MSCFNISGLKTKDSVLQIQWPEIQLHIFFCRHMTLLGHKNKVKIHKRPFPFSFFLQK